MTLREQFEKEKPTGNEKGCSGCDYLEYIDIGDEYGSYNGWDCNHHEIKQADFPHKRKCKYYKKIIDK